eukprot:Skav202463  [mRNA]  locus=scaffold149:376082:380096:+ [translate_table: standard]
MFDTKNVRRAAPGGPTRPLVLFGHSRGAAPATCVAYRQAAMGCSRANHGDWVVVVGGGWRKVYIAACPAMQLGEPTGWELLSRAFLEGGDRDLLKWFSGIQPQNILLRRTAYDTSDAEFEEQVESSKFLSDMLQLMRRQYRDATYPDPDRDFGTMSDWGRLSSNFQLETVNAGHMDCLEVQAVSQLRLYPKHGALSRCLLSSHILSHHFIFYGSWLTSPLAVSVQAEDVPSPAAAEVQVPSDAKLEQHHFLFPEAGRQHPSVHPVSQAVSGAKGST